MSDPGDNLAIVISAWLAAVRQGDTRELASVLDEDVVWQGLRSDLVCHGRTEVLRVLAHNQGRSPRLTRITAEEDGERVAMTVDGPDFEDNELLPAGAPRSLVVTVRDGRVTRIESRVG